MTDHKTVLAIFGERQRPVRFECGCTAKEELENLFEAVKVCFSDVISTSEGSSTIKEYFLQRESSDWGGMIDITGFVMDKEVVHLCCSKTASSEVCIIPSLFIQMGMATYVLLGRLAVTSALHGFKINITFNSLSGLACWPIVHTCDFNLELPTTYMNRL